MSTTITYDDVVDIASAAALNDYRTVGEKEAELWLLIAQRERWTLATAMHVVLEYVAHGADRPRLTPAAISDALRRARKQAAEAFVPPRIPDDLPPGEYPSWYRRQLAAFVDTALADWADGGELPREAVEAGPPRLALEQAPPEAREEIARHLPRVGSPRPPKRTAPSPLWLDPARREAARAELDATRPPVEAVAEQDARRERGTA